MATTQTRTAQAVRQPRAPKPMTVAQRNKLAIQGIVSTFAATDEKVAVTAVLEAVYERLDWDTSLRQRIGEKLDELTALAKPKPKLDRGSAPLPKQAPRLAQHSPLTKTNPYELAEEWGPGQLRELLGGATQKLLRDAVDVVQERNPGTRPASRTRNADMVDYIVEHVVGPEY